MPCTLGFGRVALLAASYQRPETREDSWGGSEGLGFRVCITLRLPNTALYEMKAKPDVCSGSCSFQLGPVPVQAHVTPDVAERVAAGGAVACVQHLAAEPLAIWSSHAVLIQACNQVRKSQGRCKPSGWLLALPLTDQPFHAEAPMEALHEKHGISA